MRILSVILLLATCFGVIAQGESDIFLYNLELKKDSILISNGKNISLNPGYDNQPSFAGANNIMYASTRGGATDIAAYNIPSGMKFWVNNPTEGGEYSPQLMPNNTEVAAVRLDPDGLQRLYRYSLETKDSQLLIENLKVAYFSFYDENTIACTVIVDEGLDFGIYHLNDKSFHRLSKNAGRSIHKVPNTNLMSYTTKNGLGAYEIHTITMDGNYTDTLITTLPENVQDHAWISENQLVCGKGNELLNYEVTTSKKWTPFATLNTEKLTNISRLAVSSDGKKLVLASKTDAMFPREVVQKQVESYNKRDLEAFVNCYAEDVLVTRFPLDTMYIGRDTMKQKYESYYQQVKESQVEVLKRIILGTKVIDHEVATDNGQKSFQVAIYEVDNGEIQSMNFIFDQKGVNPEFVIDKQLEAYNNRDIDNFILTYAEDVELFNYPKEQTEKGKEALRQSFEQFFMNTPDLNCEVKNRIIIGNKVIDHEYLTANGNNFYAVVIYEVINNKIGRVTFLR